MSFDTTDAADSADAADVAPDASDAGSLSPTGQAAMSEGLDDLDAPPAAPTADDPGDQWATAYPHIGGKLEADYNKEAEGKPVQISGDEESENTLEPPEGYHPGGPEGAW